MSVWGNREGSEFLACVRRIADALEVIASVLAAKKDES